MIREVKLESYLPPYLEGYTELIATLKAENPEFLLLWEAVHRLLENEFIDSADEYGISRREDLIGVLPSDRDTLESRRSRVQALWWNPTPYSIRAFIRKIAELCGESSYEVDTEHLSEYYLKITTHLQQYGQTDSLNRLLTGMPPENMVIEVLNEITTVVCAAVIYSATIIATGSRQMIDNDIRTDDEVYLSSQVLVGSYGEIYENCEGNFGRSKTISCVAEPLLVATVVSCSTQYTLQLSNE